MTEPELVPPTAELVLAAAFSPEDLAARTLDDLAQIINESLGAADRVLLGALAYSYRAGQALLEVRLRLTASESWYAWLSAHTSLSRPTATRLTKFAAHIDALPPDVFEPWYDPTTGGLRQPSFNRVAHALKGLPPFLPLGRPGKSLGGELVEQATELHRDGMTYAAIGRELSVSASTVRLWLKPGEQQKRKQYNAAKAREARVAAKALFDQRRRAERDALAKSRPGALADSYALVRRLSLKLDKAITEGIGADQRAAIENALSAAHRSEDEIVRGLRCQDPRT